MQTAIQPDVLKDLNQVQRQAVVSTEGPTLIVAGPGSGKTRVITHRIAHIIANLEHHPKNIIAVTFTNRAAREMLDRTALLIGDRSELPEIRTFHSLCAKILRADGDRIDLPRNFTIYDDDDQTNLLRYCLRSMNLKDERPNEWLERISKAKTQLMGPAEAARNYPNPKHAAKLRQIYQMYQDELHRARAADFDDLIMLTVNMLRNSQEARNKYQQNHLYFMVDEFQDTNLAQYELCKLLTAHHNNICVVGDPDQSIYSWRSAEPENINKFLTDFDQANLITLGENYRSTRRIVDASHSLILRNPRPIPNPLFTNNPIGPDISYETFQDESEEAQTIIEEIKLLREEERYSPGQCAVLYRTNAASRPIEEACLHAGLQYRIVGATTFYRRKEIRDTLAYLKLLLNRHDRIAFSRVINTPPRGLGQKSLQILAQRAQEAGQPVYSFMELIARDFEIPKGLGKKAINSITQFIQTMDLMRHASAELSCQELILTILRETKLDEQIMDSSDTTNDRWANVQTLISTAARNHSGPASENLEDFLEQAALMAQEDNEDPQADALTLITLHKAKGTEYPVVFIIGLEEGTLPHKKSLNAPKDIQEERRLFYVGVTRAQQKLYISNTRRTRSFRHFEEEATGPFTKESRFLDELFANPNGA